MEQIESYELQSFPPNRRTFANLNEANREIEYDVDVGDGFVHPHRADLYLQFDVVKKESGDAFPAAANLILVDNFVPHLFSQVEVRKHNTVIDRIDYPGITSTAVGTSKLSKTDAAYYQAGGFEAGTKISTRSHTVLFPMRLLPGFFSDYKEIMWKGGLRITFRRAANDNDALMRYATLGPDGTTPIANTLPEAAKCVIRSMELRMPVVEYETNYALKYKAEILKSPQVPIHFHGYQCVQKMASGSHMEFDVTTQFNNIQFDMPDFVVVLFQTGRDNNQEKDSSKFDDCKIKNVYLKNGRNEVFPRENYNLDMTKDDYLKLYEAYTAYKRVTEGSVDMYYTPSEFKARRPMTVINTSKRKQVVVNDRTNIKIVCEFHDALPADTLCSVILIAEKTFVYDVKNERVTEQF